MRGSSFRDRSLIPPFIQHFSTLFFADEPKRRCPTLRGF